MKVRAVTLFFGAALAAILLAAWGSGPAGPRRLSAGRAPGQLSAIVMPRDGMATVMAMIRSASSSVDLVMYELEDQAVEDALVADAARGVAVRVLLNHGYYGTPSKANANGPAYEYLKKNGVPVKWTPSYFALTHQKTLVADRRAAAIMTFNLAAQYYPTSRDLGVVDRDPSDVAAIESVFAADWEGRTAAAPNGDGLVWSPGAEDAMVGAIGAARDTLDIYNEEMADEAVVRALMAAAARGVAVRVLMTYSSQWDRAFAELATAGVEVRTYPDSKDALYFHAKMIVADGARAFIGSENFSAASLYDNRELGITFGDPAAIAPLEATFAADWQNGTPINY